MEKILKDKKDFDEMAREITEVELYKTDDAKQIIIAHGLVSAVAKEAIDILRNKGIKIGLFKPSTLSPFPKKELNSLLNKNIKKVFIIESSLGQLKNLVKQNLENKINIDVLQKPAVGIEVQEIINKITK